MQRASRDVFGHMPHLHWLDLSSNSIADIEFDSFIASRRLQVCASMNINITYTRIDGRQTFVGA